MKEILEFLNQQNGDRLFFYGLLVVIVTAIIFVNLSNMVESIANVFKNRHKKDTNGKKT